MIPIADLHCDLLSFLSLDPKHSPFDPAVRCAIPQLNAGNVVFQVMAVFTETHEGSAKEGWCQVQQFQRLCNEFGTYTECESKIDISSAPKPQGSKIASDPILSQYGVACDPRSPGIFAQLEMPVFDSRSVYFKKGSATPINIMIAIENASSLFEESENLSHGFKCLDAVEETISKIAYISLTWNTENRFGGGARTQIGLKPDGQELLKRLDGRRIAIDLSHTSDNLAYDILNFIDSFSLNIPVIASHSNFRKVTGHLRNLPDELAKEIFHRKGLVGLNFVREFVGDETPINFVKQLEHLLTLGGENSFCFGADFYFPGNLPAAYHKPIEMQFFPSFDNSSCYAKVIDLWKSHLKIDDHLIAKISHQNILNFFKN